MNTTVIENGHQMEDKERVLALLGENILRIEEELKEAQCEYGRLRLESDVEYKTIRQAEDRVRNLEGQKEAFELASNLVNTELSDKTGYAPKSVAIERRAICHNCPSELHCIALKHSDLYITKCPDGKW